MTEQTRINARGPIPLVEFQRREGEFSSGTSIDVFVPKKENYITDGYKILCEESTKSYMPWYQDCKIIKYKKI